MDNQLYIASSNGFSATADAFVIRKDRDHPDLFVQELLFASIIGGQAACKAIASGILKRDTELISFYSHDYDDEAEERRRYAAQRKHQSGTWKSRTMKLAETGAWHTIVYSTILEFNQDESNFVILGELGQDAAQDRYLQFLNRRIALPIYPDWKDWLWNRGLETGEITPLTAAGVSAWECTPVEPALQLAMMRGIRDGTLTVPRKEETYA